MAEGMKQKTLLQILEDLLTDVSTSPDSIPTSESEGQEMDVDENPPATATTDPSHEIPQAGLDKIVSTITGFGFPPNIVGDSAFNTIRDLDTIVSEIVLTFKEDFGFALSRPDFVALVPTLAGRLPELKDVSHERLVRLGEVLHYPRHTILFDTEIRQYTLAK